MQERFYLSKVWGHVQALCLTSLRLYIIEGEYGKQKINQILN